jgi:polar amino acid transport system permease protein
MFEYIVQYLPVILDGFLFTVAITLFGVLLGLGIGTSLSIGDLYGGKVASMIIRVYVEFFRGSPLIIQLFIAEYTIPSITRIPMNPYVIAFLVFALNSAAYQKGYIKGAMESVLEDQMMAGLSTGMSKPQTIRRVILPQTLRIMIPAWSNEFCSLTKSTAAVAYVGLNDLTMSGRNIIGLTYSVLPTWIVIAAIYLAWITAFTKGLDIIYEREKIPGIDIAVQ